MASPAKICAVALLLAAGSADGRIPPRQSSCSCNHGNSYPIDNNRQSYGIRHTPTGHLMSSLMSDPWFGHLDLWHDPYSLGHWLPWGLSRRPWKTGLESLFEPSCSSTDDVLGRDFRVGCHRCQPEAESTDVRGQSKGDTERNQQRNQQGVLRHSQEADTNEQLAEDQARREKEQEMEEQRLHRERQRLKEEAELNRRHQEEERRLQEESRKRQQQRLHEEEMEKRRRSEEEQRWRQRQEAEAARLQRERERSRREQQRLHEEEMERRRSSEEEQQWRQRQEAEAAHLQRERERSRRAQEEKAYYESRHREMPRGHPNQGTRTDTRHGHGNNQKNRRGQYRVIQVASLKIPGYTPEDVTVTKSGDRLTVQGKHVCDCQDSCTEREFQRGFAIPRNVDPASLGATLTQDGQLTVTGNQSTAPNPQTGDFVVKVQGDGSFTPQPRNTDSSCGGRRKGFKLKKMNKRTGEIVDDVPDLEVEMDDRTFEGEVDEDGVTMEVEY